MAIKSILSKKINIDNHDSSFYVHTGSNYFGQQAHTNHCNHSSITDQYNYILADRIFLPNIYIFDIKFYYYFT